MNKNNNNLEMSENYIDLINKLIKNDSFHSYYNYNIYYNKNNIQNNNENNENNNEKNDKNNENKINYYEKLMFHPWFNNIKIKDILDNVNGIYNVVIKEF